MADQITFITRFDAEPEFWQFLSGLTRRDIITERIQNELDADSTKTTITFAPNCLSCVGVGEPLEFSPPTTETIAQIFESACQEIPRQFIGCLRPGIRERYTIVLCHHAAGTVTYSFRCTAKRRLRRGWIFGRTCTVSGNIP